MKKRERDIELHLYKAVVVNHVPIYTKYYIYIYVWFRTRTKLWFVHMFGFLVPSLVSFSGNEFFVRKKNELWDTHPLLVSLAPSRQKIKAMKCSIPGSNR